MNLSGFRHCRRCSGRCFLDRGTVGEDSIDLVCINCGGRRYIQRNTPEGRYLINLESERGNTQ